MDTNNIIRNADRFQMGMQVAGTPQTVNVNDLLSQQNQEIYKGAFPLEPFPLQAITTKLENIIIDYKDVISFINQLKTNPVIKKEQKEFLQQINKNIKNIISETMQTVKLLDNIVD